MRLGALKWGYIPQLDSGRWQERKSVLKLDGSSVTVTPSLNFMVAVFPLVSDNSAAFAMPAGAPFSAVRQGTPLAEIGKAHPVG